MLQRWLAAQGDPRDIVVGVPARRGVRGARVAGRRPVPDGARYVELTGCRGDGAHPARARHRVVVRRRAAARRRLPRRRRRARAGGPAGAARAPCLVSFSGGRDSSAVLAAAAAVARREGCPPRSRRRCGPRVSRRATRQRGRSRSSRHLGLDDWVRIECTTSSTRRPARACGSCARTDCCGRATRTSTCRCWSSRAAARSSPGSAATSCSSSPPPRRRGAGARSDGPRRAAAARRAGTPRARRLPWLTPAARRAATAARGAAGRSRAAWRPRPHGVAARAALPRPRRSTRSRRLAADEDVELAHPLFDARPVERGRPRAVRGFADRTTRAAGAVRRAAAGRRSRPSLQGELRPRVLRPPRAAFAQHWDGPVSRPASWTRRRCARTGCGGDAGRPDVHAAAGAWLASARDGLEQPLGAIAK